MTYYTWRKSDQQLHDDCAGGTTANGSDGRNGDLDDLG
jgi:hypothetical protein